MTMTTMIKRFFYAIIALTMYDARGAVDDLDFICIDKVTYLDVAMEGGVIATTFSWHGPIEIAGDCTIRNGTIRNDYLTEDVLISITRGNVVFENVTFDCSKCSPQAIIRMEFGSEANITFKGNCRFLTANDDVDVIYADFQSSGNIVFDESFTGSVNGKVALAYDARHPEDEPSVSVTVAGNGMFKNYVALDGGSVDFHNSSVQISGGAFAVEPATVTLAVGYQKKQSADKYWEISPRPAGSEYPLYIVVDVSQGPTAQSYPVTRMDVPPAAGWDETYKSGKIVLRRIEAGTFTMGLRANEYPGATATSLHSVTLTKPFYESVFEITQKQWELVMGTNPSTWTGDLRPVHDISYLDIRGSVKGIGWPASAEVDAESFMGRLRAKTGFAGFDLPTEAQWEYACRAGTETGLNSGKNIVIDYDWQSSSNEPDPNLSEVGYYLGNYSVMVGTVGNGPLEVGSFKPNAWGLYDCHGNASEWCLDYLVDYFGYDPANTVDPVGVIPSGTCNYRVIKGGAWMSYPDECASGGCHNGFKTQNSSDYFVGCRLVLNHADELPNLDDEPVSGGGGDEQDEEALYMVIDLSGGTSATSFPVKYLQTVPEGGWTKEYKTNKLVLRRVEAGEFVMGSPDDEPGHQWYPYPEDRHKVTLMKPFYVGVFEITQKQWNLVVGHPAQAWGWYDVGDARPADNITYNDIRGDNLGSQWPSSSSVDSSSFIGVLRAKTGKDCIDLPTEAQWEYACRAGTTTALNSGKGLTNANGKDANMDEVGRYSYDEDDGNGGYNSGTTTVGSYLPNNWGLYDMHGNVCEWCLDWTTSDRLIDETDPVGATVGDGCRSVRGGNACNNAGFARSASRDGEFPSSYFVSIGFRIVCTLRENTPLPPPDEPEDTELFRFDGNGADYGSMRDVTVDPTAIFPINQFVRDGYSFLGWAQTSTARQPQWADGEWPDIMLFDPAETVHVVYAVWGRVPSSDTSIDFLWPQDVAFSASIANTYDGFLWEGENLVGLVQVKTTKQSVKTTTDKVTKEKTVTTNITATATVTDANGKKWSYSKGTVTVDGVVNGLKCTAKGCPVAEFGVTLGRNGLEGEWDAYEIHGARNGMGMKGDEMMSALAAYKGKWSVTLSCASLTSGQETASPLVVRLQFDVQAKGVVKIAGNWESGAKVSASVQMVMGDGFVYVPVMVKQTKTSPALNALLRIDSNAAATGMSSPQAVTLLSGGELVAGGRTAEELGEPDYLPSAVSAGGKAFLARVAVDELAYPAKFAAKKLPTGLKIDAATGVISGTPTKPGHYVAEVTVTSGLNSKVKKTLTVEFDIANYTDDLIPIEDSYGPYYVGVSAVEQIAAAAGCTASGLPSGLKWTAKDIVDTKTKAVKTAANTVYGIPTKACTSTVYFKKTVKELVNGKQKSVTHQASATFIVEGMKPWAYGNFNGGNTNGIVTLTVSNVGKISGKWMSEGLTWTLSAASFDAYDAEREAYHATVTAKSGKETKTLELVHKDGYICASLTSGKDSASPLWEAWRNGWKEEPQKTLATKLKGKKVQVGEVVLTVGASGAVTAKGTFVTGFDEKKQKDITYSATCSTVLIPTAEAGLYRVYLYFPPKSGKFDGFADVVEIGLGDD